MDRFSGATWHSAFHVRNLNRPVKTKWREGADEAARHSSRIGLLVSSCRSRSTSLLPRSRPWTCQRSCWPSSVSVSSCSRSDTSSTHGDCDGLPTRRWTWRRSAHRTRGSTTASCGGVAYDWGRATPSDLHTNGLGTPHAHPLNQRLASPPETLVKAFRLETLDEAGEWWTPFETEQNYQRIVRIALDVTATAIRLTPLSTWGATLAHVQAWEIT